ncbi:MAG TPA: SCO family protein [Verrucomicrobiae bacterium]|nr:SCO family protein [Verrucomicrobiae bacterium]
MMKRHIGLVVAALLPWLLASCMRGEAAKGHAVYQAKGVVRKVMAETKSVTIAHENIPGYMEAMTMDFSVTNATELTGLRPGDVITFRVTVTADNGWIDQIRKTGATNAIALPPEPFRRVRYVEPVAVGDPMPDYTFTNELGKIVHLSDFKGQAYALNFIFTRCPFPTFCPRQSKGFSEAQEKLKSTPGGPTNWHFLSITIDPAYDTPARLKGYAATYHADPARWTFLTGDLEDITAIGEQVGLQFWREKPDALPNHNVRTVVVDAAGRIQWVTVQNEWETDALVEQMIKAAAAKGEG